jgi:hypothetical protein
MRKYQSAQFSTKFGPKLTEYPFQMCQPLLHQSYGLGMTGLQKCISLDNEHVWAA